MVEIREAKPEDAEQIAQVHVKSWQTTYQKMIDEEVLSSMRWEDRVDTWRQTIEALENNASILGAFEGDQLVGFLSGGTARKSLDNCDAEIYAIYLLKESRGKGIGKKLMDSFFSWLKENDYTSCLVWVTEKNPYQSFYPAMGARLSDYRGVSRIQNNKFTTVAYIWDKI